MNRLLIILLIGLAFVSCGDIVKEEDVSTLIGLSHSENVVVNEKGSDLIIEIYNSELDKDERGLYHTTIALFAYDKANKNRNMLFVDGKSVVNFIESNKTIDSYSIVNSEMSKIRKIYDDMLVLLEGICGQDFEKVYSLIDEDILNEIDRKGMAKVLMESEICKNHEEYLIYGFNKVENDGVRMAFLYVDLKYTDSDDRKILFIYSAESLKLIGAEELSS
jgi:hypothetical protein